MLVGFPCGCQRGAQRSGESEQARGADQTSNVSVVPATVHRGLIIAGNVFHDGGARIRHP